MQVIDLFSHDPDLSGCVTECDVCIVGTGPAGAVLARELSGSKLRIAILESGGFQRRPEVDALNDIENVGRGRASQWAVRNRIVGGSSHTWGGRCAPFDAIDFEVRSWVPGSGWPLDPDSLHSYLDRSAPHLGLAVGTGFSGNDFWKLAGRARPDDGLDPQKLLPFFWQFSRDPNESYPFEYMRYERHLPRDSGPSSTTLIVGANVLRIVPDDNRAAVSSVEFATPGGGVRQLQTTAVVLCCGGIENARILLSSDTHDPAGLGNTHDQVGRYLMDHLRGPVGTFQLRGSENFQKRFGRYNVQKRLFRGGLRLSPDIQRSEHLLNCAAWLGEVLSDSDPWVSLRRIAGGKPQLPRDLIAVMANTTFLMRGLRDYLAEANGFPRKLDGLELICMTEQLPDPDSRVTLSDRCDRFGIRLPRLDWRSHPEEARTMRRMAEIAAEEFERAGMPRLELMDWVKDQADFPATFVDVAHPTGTTRMSDTARTGVVDRNCEVHGVSGLYVAGTSVFPTAGHCNPTQLIVALAIRLADHIKSVKPAIRSRAPAYA